ncbi:YoaK family protein [[Clostridium] colinum]|uniref:YoaK family protein n=1 Tax=[Clostridium] colinum TaxID=36835 RepID=UPI0020252A05|nr:YoaK family protein [[Clostridium] colinum]
MTNKKACHIEENIYISLILTFIGGFLDSYTYVLYDKIFANTQTGNIIFFSIFLVEGEFYNAFLRLLPIISFCLGIIIAQILIYKFNKNKKWINIVLSINIVCTAIIGLGLLKDYMVIIICLISFICSLMIATFKKSKGDVFAPIMCTGNLRSLMEFFCKWTIYKEKSAKKVVLKYLFIIITFMLGVSLGIILVNYFRISSIYICTILFISVLLIIIYHKNFDKI